jgi:hypothetical protein
VVEHKAQSRTKRVVKTPEVETAKTEMGVGQGARNAEAMLEAAATGGEIALDGGRLIAAIGCSTLKLPLRRATQSLDRLTSSWLRRIWMASLTRKPCR